MSLSNMLTTNRQLKLLSLLLAVFLWLFATLEAVDQIDLPVSVSYQNSPTGFTAGQIVGAKPVARLEAPRVLLLRQQIKGVSATLDVSAARDGKIKLSASEVTVKLIPGVKLVSFLPLMFEIK